MNTTETKWLIASAVLAVGEYCGFRCQGISSSWPAALFLAAIIALFGFGFSIRGHAYVSLGIAGFALALMTTERIYSVIRDAHIHSSGKPYSAVFSLRDDAIVRHTAKGAMLAEFLGYIDLLRVKVQITLPPGTAPPKAGETWQCAGWLSGWNDSDILQMRRFRVQGKGTSFSRIAADTSRGYWRHRLHSLRQDMARRLRLGLEGDEHSHNLLCAMLLGQRGKMTAQDRKIFVDAGAMHVFAISGLHVMVLARFFVFLTILTLIPLRFAGIIAIPLISLYVVMVGSPPSAVRAGVMASICLIATLFWRRPNGIVAWAISFIVSHTLNPLQIVNVGSAYSFIVMLALVILIRFGSGATERPFIGTLAFSSVAWAAALPISVRVFGRVALSGLVSGPLVLPTAMCATICGAIGVLASFISERLAAYPIACAGILMRIMSGICSVVASLPGGNFVVAPWSIGLCLAYYCALAIAFRILLHILAPSILTSDPVKMCRYGVLEISRRLKNRRDSRSG